MSGGHLGTVQYLTKWGTLQTNKTTVSLFKPTISPIDGLYLFSDLRNHKADQAASLSLSLPN